jgi:hypothetical protein
MPALDEEERLSRMKSAWIVGGVIAAVCVALAIFYALPGVTHPLTFSGSPTAPHYKHTLLFGGLAIIALIGARFAANSSQTR